MSEVVHPYYFSRKKIWFDRLLAVTSLVLVVPLLLALGGAIAATVGRPIFYTQRRLGHKGQSFVIYKFRTMRRGAHRLQSELLQYNQAPGPMFKIFDDPRFVGIGRWLSKTGLDELPQIINILKGEMSFVGPRPLPLAEARQLSAAWRFRERVKPGIFSEWTVAEYRHRSLADWLNLDELTLRRGGWGYDLKIMIKTLVKVLV